MTTYTIAEQVLALFIVIATGTLGGIFVALIQGYKIPKFGRFPGLTIPPLLRHIVIPPLLGMIIMSCVAINCFGPRVAAWPSTWTPYMKAICHCYLLIRAGLSLEFKGNVLSIIIITLVPQQVECNVAAWLARHFFGMPVAVCYTLGYVVAAVSPSVTVPTLISLTERGFGGKNKIPKALIAAGTFEDISAIILHGLCLSISISLAQGTGSRVHEGGVAAGMIIAQEVAGIGICAILAALGWFLNFIKNYNLRHAMKTIYCALMAIAIVCVSAKVTFTQSEYIGGLTFGYVSSKVWGKDKPYKPLAFWWVLICTFLFSTTGAGLKFSTITPKFLGYSAIIIVVAVICRLITVSLVSYNRRYSIKERLFIVCTWVPKATVQASLSAVFLTNAKSHNLGAKYIEYGNIILSTAILSIVICAPIGAVLMNTFGPKLLPKNIEEETDDEDLKARNPDEINEIELKDCNNS